MTKNNKNLQGSKMWAWLVSTWSNQGKASARIVPITDNSTAITTGRRKPDTVARDDLEGETNIEMFLDQAFLFQGAERAIYLQDFKELISLIPQAEVSPVLLQIVAAGDLGLLDAYLDHPHIQQRIDSHYVNPASLWNAFCVIYSRRTEDKTFDLKQSRDCIELLTQNRPLSPALAMYRGVENFRISFDIDMLRGVLMHVKPLPAEDCPYANLRQALADFFNYRKKFYPSERVALNAEQHRLLFAALKAHPDLKKDPVVQYILTQLHPAKRLPSATKPFFAQQISPVARAAEIGKDNSIK